MEYNSDEIIKLSVLGLLMLAGIWWFFRGVWILIFLIILTVLDVFYLLFVILSNTKTAFDLILPILILIALIYGINKLEKKGKI